MFWLRKCFPDESEDNKRECDRSIICMDWIFVPPYLKFEVEEL